MKRAYKIFSVCAVFLIFIGSFSVLSFSSAADLSNSFPPSRSYPNSDFLPYGDDTICLCVLYSNGTRCYRFFAKSQFVSDSNANIWSCYWYTVQTGTQRRHHIWIESYSPIICNDIVGNSSSYSQSGTWNSSVQMYQYDFDLYRTDSYPLGAWCSFDQRMNNMNLKTAYNAGYNLLGSDQDIDNYYWKVRPYPSSVSEGVEALEDLYENFDNSLTDLSDELDLYYGSLDDSLSELSSQVSELQSQVSVMSNQISSQSGEFQSALNNAQSSIESNANAAASQVADDINNAGEDMSDINDNIDEVNDIVDQLDEWISELDVFADRIDDAADGVADALDTGSDLLSNFLSICPPIVLALFAFALVFLVVRKIIGR